VFDYLRIGYIDDDLGSEFSELIKINDAISSFHTDMKISYPKIKCELVTFEGCNSKEEFLLKISRENYYALILDYELVKSKIFNSAKDIWQEIKKNNPLFPLAIITSHDFSIISFDKSSESFFLLLTVQLV